MFSTRRSIASDSLLMHTDCMHRQKVGGLECSWQHAAKSLQLNMPPLLLRWTFEFVDVVCRLSFEVCGWSIASESCRTGSAAWSSGILC
jgi:hypothetical protein